MFEENDEFLLNYFDRNEYNEKIKFLVKYYKFHHEIPRIFNIIFERIFHFFYNSLRRIEYNRIKKLLQDEDE